MLSLPTRSWLGWTLVLSLGSLPVFAQEANFSPLYVARGGSAASASVTGQTGGAFSLANLGGRDRAGNRCLGFGSPTPDHIMVLEEDFDHLSLTVHTGGNDTTLVIQNPDQSFRCGDDGGSGQDAKIEDNQWSAGTYRIWVGSLEAGQRWRYRLSASL